MRKLKLETLQVQSFATTPAAHRRPGTVHAASILLPTYDPQVCGPNVTVGCSEPSHESSWCTEDTCHEG
jgi:hypothetical protein